MKNVNEARCPLPGISWWCPTCERKLDGAEVTFEEMHDPDYRGCGQQVELRIPIWSGQPAQNGAIVGALVVDFTTGAFLRYHVDEPTEWRKQQDHWTGYRRDIFDRMVRHLRELFVDQEAGTESELSVSEAQRMIAQIWTRSGLGRLPGAYVDDRGNFKA